MRIGHKINGLAQSCLPESLRIIIELKIVSSAVIPNPKYDFWID